MWERRAWGADLKRGDHCRGVVVALFDTIYGERGEKELFGFL